MAQELINTSVPRGLRPGAQGYCTVAYTEGMPPNYVKLAESLSAYSPVFPASDPRYFTANPTAFSCYQVTVGGQALNVLSRVACHALDFTKRSNYLAHHLLIDPSNEALAAAGPAAVMHDPATFRRTWDAPPQLIPDSRPLPAVLEPAGYRAAGWSALGVDPGWAGQLAAHFLDDPASVAWVFYDPEQAPGGNPDGFLELVADAVRLVPPAKRWQITFTTYYQGPFLRSPCNWCFCAHGSQAQKGVLFRAADLRLDLAKPLPELVGGNELVDCARSGARPTWARWEPPPKPEPRLEVNGDAPPTLQGPPPWPARDAAGDALAGRVAGVAEPVLRPVVPRPGEHRPAAAGLVWGAFLVLALAAAAFLFQVARKTNASLPRVSPTAPPARAGLPAATRESLTKPVTALPAEPDQPVAAVPPAPPALPPLVPPPPLPAPVPPSRPAVAPGPLVLVTPRMRAETHNLKDLQQALAGAAISAPPTTMAELRVRLFAVGPGAAAQALPTAAVPVRTPTRDASAAPTETLRYAFTGDKAKGSLDILERSWKLSPNAAGPGGLPPSVAIVEPPDGSAWRALDILQCLEFPLRLTSALFAPSADGAEAGFGGRLGLDLEPFVAVSPAGVAAAVRSAVIAAARAGDKPARFEWSAKLALVCPAAVWGQERAVVEDSFSGVWDPSPADERHLVFTLQPQFGKTVGRLLKDYEKAGLRGLSEATARSLESDELLQLATAYEGKAEAVLAQFPEDDRKRLSEEESESLREALDRLQQDWQRGGASLSVTELQHLLDTKSWQDLAPLVRRYGEVLAAETWEQGQATKGKSRSRPKKGEKSSREIYREDLLPLLREQRWIATADPDRRADPDPLLALLRAELRVLDGDYPKGVQLSEPLFLTYRRDSLKLLWLRKLRAAEGSALAAAAERLSALDRQRLHGASPELDRALAALLRTWGERSLPELQELLRADGAENEVPRGPKKEPLVDIVRFGDYRRDTLQRLWLRQRLEQDGAELAARWQQVVRRQGYWLEVRVLEVTCRSAGSPDPFLRARPEGQRPAGSAIVPKADPAATQ
jgi:hypothetical protein